MRRGRACRTGQVACPLSLSLDGAEDGAVIDALFDVALLKHRPERAMLGFVELPSPLGEPLQHRRGLRVCGAPDDFSPLVFGYAAARVDADTFAREHHTRRMRCHG